MKKFGYAVLIGRFQPFHLGHLALFKAAKELADKVIIIVGSHHAPRSIRNPWSSDQRKEHILLSLEEKEAEGTVIIPMPDSAYNFTDWILRVQKSVNAIAGNSPVTLVGHYKDDTSYYLDHFPQWHLSILPEQADGISSTRIRTAIFEGDSDLVRRHLHPNVFQALAKWSSSFEFQQLSDEYRFIKEYRKRWDSAPYPPVFVTADAVVVTLGHVLIIKRKLNPGKGRWALPGGFVSNQEHIESACLRELKEETGIDLPFPLLKSAVRMNHVFDHPLRDPRGRVITHAFLFELNLKSLPALSAGDDADMASWFPLCELEEKEELFFNDHAQIIKYFVNRMR
jgi:bifunctional NMN adenylyltransferase/nudix hydrolase